MLCCPEKGRSNKIFLGAFGTVYLAQRLSDDREVILKQIPGIQMTLPMLDVIGIKG
jgi:hypothetical protein